MAILPLAVISQDGQPSVHDPVMIKAGNAYYLFATGEGISVFSSSDMKKWKQEKPVFEEPPKWAQEAVPGFKGHIWAPDISFHNNQYYLFYSVSAFGKNTSAIGVATNKTLDPLSPDYSWEDKGMVIQSVPGRDLWNAIDPSLIIDQEGQPWLTFGSFWNGIKLVRLNNDLLSLAEPQEWHTLARRNRGFEFTDPNAGDAAIEAPFIFKKGGDYYLFVSWDYCCRAENSNYKVIVGRSNRVMGPYFDKEGKPLFMGGGSVIVEGDNKKWFGTGHPAAYTFNGDDYLIYHGYDATNKGRPKLVIDQLDWKDGWPIIKKIQ